LPDHHRSDDAAEYPALFWGRAKETWWSLIINNEGSGWYRIPRWCRDLLVARARIWAGDFLNRIVSQSHFALGNNHERTALNTAGRQLAEYVTKCRVPCTLLERHLTPVRFIGQLFARELLPDMTCLVNFRWIGIS
jgi:hypothetical protein